MSEDLSRLARSTLRTALTTLLLYTAHHLYGAIHYATPWRHHAAFVAVALSLAIFGAYAAHERLPKTPAGRGAAWGLAALVVVFPVLVIGAFEGAYNHVAKDVLFFAGLSRETFSAMFPAPTYELPNDAWFEISGVAQVIPALFAGLASWRLVRALLSTRGERHALGGPAGVR